MSSFVRLIRKIFVSAFVIVTFAAYVLHERVTNPGDQAASAPAPIAVSSQQSLPPARGSSAIQGNSVPTPFVLPTITPLSTPAPEAPPVEVPSRDSSQEAFSTPQLPALQPPTEFPTQEPPTEEPPTEVPTVEAAGQYKDGSYTGPEVNATYGWVQVQAVVQNGQLADVQFLEYPRDRRTSQRINSRAVPELQTEAIQVQSANVDIISGATLTSRAFIESLKSALTLASG